MSRRDLSTIPEQDRALIQRYRATVAILHAKADAHDGLADLAQRITFQPTCRIDYVARAAAGVQS